MANKTSFRCKLVTPTAALLDDEVKYASIPGWDGLLGVMPGRAPLLIRLGMGELRLDFADTQKYEGGRRSYFLEGGVAKMEGDRLTILAESAIPAEQLSEPEAQQELATALNAQISAKGEAFVAASEKRSQAQARARAKLQMLHMAKGI